MNDFDKQYLDICTRLLDAPKVNGTRELRNVLFTVDDITDNIVSVRNISLSYLFGELVWYFTGRNDLDFISKFSSFWNHLSDDGVTCNSAYGYLMIKGYGFDQIAKVIELLSKDKDSRRAVINLNIPNVNVIETKDEPCTIALQFLVRDDKLHCTTMMRSNDIWFGLPYDFTFFTEVQKLIARGIGVECGSYTHFATSLHLYDRDEAKIRTIVERPFSVPVEFDDVKFFDNVDVINNVMKVAKDPKRDIISAFDTLGICKQYEQLSFDF